MSAISLSPPRWSRVGTGDMIVFMLAGVLLSIIVTLTGVPAETPVSQDGATVEVVSIGDSQGGVLPPIAQIVTSDSGGA